MQDATPTWFWPLFPFFFVGFVCGISYLLSVIGGWRDLAHCYPDEPSSREGKRFRFQSAQLRCARLRSVGYSHCVNVTVNPIGIRLSVTTPFRFGHPPIWVPWQDVRVEWVNSWLNSVGVLRFAREPAITVRLGRRLIDRIVYASSGQLQFPLKTV